MKKQGQKKPTTHFTEAAETPVTGVNSCSLAAPSQLGW